jgi:molybdopterin/thiamine biosynthesis adenylyltransferase
MINKICYNIKKPLIVGAAIRYEGHVLKLNNTKDDNSCLNCLYSSSDENLENCEGNGIMSPVAGMIGSMMANECIKTLIGINNNKENTISIFDLKNNIYQRINIPKNKKCSVCS